MAGNSTAFHQPIVLKLSARCDLGEARTAVQTIHDFLAEQGWGEDDLISFDLALVEACNNAVKYAGEAGRRQPIVVETICEAIQVEFRVHDHTPGFVWPEKIKLPDPESESGRGLYLITTLMDHAGYFRGQGENMLIMRKSRPRQGTGIALAQARDAEDPARKLAGNERVISDLVEELSSCYESLSAIFRYGTIQGETRSLKEFAQRLFGDLLQIIPAEWFILRLAPKDESRLVVFAASEPALELEPLVFAATGKLAASTEIQAAVTRKRVWFDSHKRATDGALSKAKPGCSGLVHPIVLGEELIGTLALGKRDVQNHSSAPEELVFTAAQTNVVNTFVDFLAIQIARTRFQEEEFNRRLVTHELGIAKNIQRSLLPISLPQLPGFSLAAFCRNAHEVGGDFYDVLEINEHSLLLVIADVMGKGIPAAMFAAILRTLLRAAPELAQQPSALLTRVNRFLFPDLSAVDMFITAQLAFVDARGRKIVTASAGHCPLLVASSKEVAIFSPEGMPLGITPDTKYQDETLDLPVNCNVLLYTDGLTDALDAKKEYFGQQRLMDWLKRTTATRKKAEQLKDDLAHQLAQHQLNTVLNDDQTFLILAG